jgi:hypothetical protein
MTTVPVVVEWSCYVFELNRSINSKWTRFGLCHYCIQWANYHSRLVTDIASPSETLLKIADITNGNSPQEITLCYMIFPVRVTGVVGIKTPLWILLSPASVLLFTMLRNRPLPVAITGSINLPIGFLGDVLKRKETNRPFCSKLSS